MKFERDERKFDFHDIGYEIKRKRETSGMTQDQLAFIIDRDPRTVMYHENDGQHPSLNIFYQLVTRFDISVDLHRTAGISFASLYGFQECRNTARW